MTFKVTREGELAGRGELVKITEDVRKYAAEHGLTDAEAIESGMQEKRKEFLEKGKAFTRRLSGTQTKEVQGLFSCGFTVE